MKKIDELDLDKICASYSDGFGNDLHSQPNIFTIIDKINEIIEALNETN